jgi:toxin ParE1/3/4
MGGRVRPANSSTSSADAMAYRVEVTLRAEEDFNDLYELFSTENSAPASKWMDGLESAISSLEQFPHRCPLVPENKGAKHPLRHLLYGAKREVYRVIYEIDVRRKVVRVLAIRHGAMDEFIGGAS